MCARSAATSCRIYPVCSPRNAWRSCTQWASQHVLRASNSLRLPPPLGLILRPCGLALDVNGGVLPPLAVGGLGLGAAASSSPRPGSKSAQSAVDVCIFPEKGCAAQRHESPCSCSSLEKDTPNKGELERHSLLVLQPPRRQRSLAVYRHPLLGLVHDFVLRAEAAHSYPPAFVLRTQAAPLTLNNALADDALL